MSIISAIIHSLGHLFRYHKKKILFFLGSIVFCFIVLFPYDDLSDLVTHQVSIRTNNNIYLQFDNLAFGFLPQLGLKMSDVLIESVFAPTLSVETLGVAPKISSLIFGTPGGKIKAQGFFGGDASVSFGRSNKLQIEGQELGIDVDAESIDLKKLTKFLKTSYNLPIEASGSTDIESLVHIDPLFKNQPMGNVNLILNDVVVPPTSIPLGGFMTYSLPGLKLSQVVLKGNIQDRKFIIKEGKLGNPKNDLFGDITGEVVLDVRPGPRMKLGGYDLKLNLNFSESLRKQLELVLGVIDGYQGIGNKFKSESLKGVRYNLTLSSHSMAAPPKISGP